MHLTRAHARQMYIVPYPYHCVMVYDDAKDYSFVRARARAACFMRRRPVACLSPAGGPQVRQDEFVEFVQKNLRADVVRKREHRMMLRAMRGSMVHLEHNQMGELVAPWCAPPPHVDAQTHIRIHTNTNTHHIHASPERRDAHGT
jgi:hypothetical protein